MTSDGFVFEPDLARAGSLPSSWYRDPAVLDRELVRVFARTWQLMAHTEALGEPGAFDGVRDFDRSVQGLPRSAWSNGQGSPS